MKIAYLTQSYPPMINGVSFVVRNLSKAMVEYGHSVLVVTASDRGEPYLMLDGNIQLLNLRSHRNPLRTGQRFTLYPRQAVMKALQDFKPDIVHVHDPLQTGLLGLEYAHRFGVPSILTVHGLPTLVSTYFQFVPGLASQIDFLLWMYAWWLVRQYSSVLAPTATISHLVGGITKIPPKTISNGVDLKMFHPAQSLTCKFDLRKTWGLPSDAPVILHVGQLHTAKRVDFAIRAAARAMEGTDAHLLIAGDGPEKGRLMKLCEGLGIVERVHFPGYITQENGLPEVFRLANVFITASEIETQGLVLLEAAASGLPIVAVNATCIPEIVHEGVNGFLAKPCQVQSFGASITALLQNPRLAKEMGMASRKIAACHNIHKSMDAHQELYLRLVRQKHAEPIKERAIFQWK